MDGGHDRCAPVHIPDVLILISLQFLFRFGQIIASLDHGREVVRGDFGFSRSLIDHVHDVGLHHCKLSARICKTSLLLEKRCFCIMQLFGSAS